MTIQEVIETRHSVRAYKEQPLADALLAPTAVNQQKFSFEYVGMTNNRHQVRAKYHFEIGAGEVNFEWV